MTSNNETKGVNILLGDPKKAVLKLSIPMIIAMTINSLYALIDGIWVAGIGDSALAAIGFVNPVYLIVMGFSNGIGAGATAVISRYIGAKNKNKADNGALHVMVLTVILSILFTFTFVVLLKPILELIGAGSTIDLSLEYGQTLFLGSIFIVFSSTAYGILRAEGNVSKTTYAMLLGAIINIILDPIFIYTLKMGVSGAAIATIISLAAVSLLLLYWFKRDTYIDLSSKKFKPDLKLTKQILNVGVPAGMEFLIIAILSGTLNAILMITNGVDAVAVYTAGWRVVMIAMVPAISIGVSSVAVVGANFGAERFKNMKIVYNYSIKLGFIIIALISIAIFILAPYISYIFTYSPQTAGLGKLITDFLRVTCLFYIFLPIGITSSSLFQGVGKGFNALAVTAIRLLILEVIFAYVLAIPLGFGQYGVWFGIVLGNGVGSLIAYIWSKTYLRKIERHDEILNINKSKNR
ncbi:MATE family efflux transporter [Methanobrevibacter filiformis]|uniref:Multidrug export protein MepA n=1 Tax=Methanobrevibacter filiformis TaxID=55758 RepID=A0A166F9X7_9EURY|nr:MATE family efflux transporter [Methanobrevibacter filiformis]KZX17453.1 multidrug export protein MepA [Methanobrevibacter filiformis]